MCSTPTAQPCGPTMIAKQAVKYPVPVSKSQAESERAVLEEGGAERTGTREGDGGYRRSVAAGVRRSEHGPGAAVYNLLDRGTVVALADAATGKCHPRGLHPRQVAASRSAREVACVGRRLGAPSAANASRTSILDRAAQLRHILVLARPSRPI
ncbi:hypothetical protein B296_00020444 [Ensete ventricosum]|uniref:Uncharacterized protein n=1 Tax=Ensete ventricosum TaxID=4639 RepID=A0A427A8F8_ENSVE|nr:hypothetical protein B296_00020444 [Ensete ventricosum]